MHNQTIAQANAETRDAWNANAAYWDERMGDDGNDFVNKLIWPAAVRLLDLQTDERVLDIGCGNGLYARRLAESGATVIAFDFAAEMVALAQKRTADYADQITYQVLDATDETALLALGAGRYDAALSNMALMDMAEIEPLFLALAILLKPGGRFVFSITHPCFNQANTVHMAEMEDRDGEIVTVYSVKTSSYMTSTTARGAAIAGQPKPQLYFDRSLQTLLGVGFAAGFVLDGLEERAFSSDDPSGRNPLGWNGNFSEIPPVLVARTRLPK